MLLILRLYALQSCMDTKPSSPLNRNDRLLAWTTNSNNFTFYSFHFRGCVKESKVYTKNQVLKIREYSWIRSRCYFSSDLYETVKKWVSRILGYTRK